MNESATSFAIARRNQWISFSFFTAETDFATSFTLFKSLIVLFNVFLDLKNSIRLFKMVGVSDRFCLIFVLGFNNHIFHSSEFDDVSGF